MGESTISMAIFNSYVKLPEGRLLIAGSTGLIIVADVSSQSYKKKNSLPIKSHYIS